MSQKDIKLTIRINYLHQRKQHPSTLWQSRTRSPAPTGPGAHTPRHRPRRPLFKGPGRLVPPPLISDWLPLPASIQSPPRPAHTSSPPPFFPFPLLSHWPSALIPASPLALPLAARSAAAQRGPAAAASPSSGRRHVAAARGAAGLRAAVRPGRAAPRQPPAAARGLPRRPEQRLRARPHRAGPARQRLGLQRPAGAARALHIPPRGVRGVRGARGPRRQRHGAAGAGARLRQVRRAGARRRGPHAGAVPGAGWHRVRRAAELPARQQALHQVHRALFYNHFALLVFPGLLRSGSLLPGPHGDCCGEAADARRPRDLVVRGSDSPHHRRADAQRWQQLVHGVLRGANLVPEKTTASPQGWRWTLPHAAWHQNRLLVQLSALHKRGFTKL